MKRRGFLAALFALPFMPFVGKRDAATASGMRMVGSSLPYVEAFPAALRDISHADIIAIVLPFSRSSSNHVGDAESITTG